MSAIQHNAVKSVHSPHTTWVVLPVAADVLKSEGTTARGKNVVWSSLLFISCFSQELGDEEEMVEECACRHALNLFAQDGVAVAKAGVSTSQHLVTTLLCTVFSSAFVTFEKKLKSQGSLHFK